MYESTAHAAATPQRFAQNAIDALPLTIDGQQILVRRYEIPLQNVNSNDVENDAGIQPLDNGIYFC